MATKKKAVKSARKTPPVKKATPPKKAAAAKPAHTSGNHKPIKKAAPSKNGIAKPVAKKPASTPAPATKKPVSIPAKKPAAPSPAATKNTIKQPSSPVISAAKQPPVVPNKPVIKEESKPIIHTPLPTKPEPKKVTPPAKPVKVVIPEMKTKTVRKYEPEFTRSVLDTPQEEQTGPTMRYSDVELAEFRELINRKLDAAKKELAYLQGLITRKDEMGGDNDDARYMTMEDGSMSMEREQLSQMASRQITFIDHLEKAVMRIENKTYGICRVTGKLIDKARLRAVPHATLSIEAKQMMNK